MRRLPAWFLLFIVFCVLGVFIVGPLDRFGFFMGMSAAGCVAFVAIVEELNEG